MKKFVCTIITALCALSLYAQEPDTLSTRWTSVMSIATAIITGSA